MTKVWKPPELELELDCRIDVCKLPGEEERLVRGIVEEAVAGIDHGNLPGREREGQHPVSAIEGLKGELERIPAPTEALTNFELEELLK